MPGTRNTSFQQSRQSRAALERLSNESWTIQRKLDQQITYLGKLHYSVIILMQLNSREERQVPQNTRPCSCMNARTAQLAITAKPPAMARELRADLGLAITDLGLAITAMPPVMARELRADLGIPD